MADAQKLKGTDTLRIAYPKLNTMIDLVNNFKAQIDQMTIEGDSSVEAAQARIDKDGTTFTTLKERLDNSDELLQSNTDEIGDKSTLPSWLQESLRNVSKIHDDYLRQFLLNVRMPPFNAKGDGVADDKQAIQDAIDHAYNNGYSGVYFPKPAVEYAVSDTILIYSKQIYNGCGKGITFIKQSTADKPVMASKNFYDTSSPSGRMIVKGLTLKGNTANPNNHGLLVRDYYSVVDIGVSGVGGDGIRFTIKNSAGTNVGGTLVENRIENCEVRNAGKYSFYLGELNNNIVTDGFLNDCISASPGNGHVYIGSAAGWNLDGLHEYGTTPSYANEIYNIYHTKVNHIYVESFLNRAFNLGSIQKAGSFSNISVKCDSAVAAARVFLLEKSSLVTEADVSFNNIQLVQESNVAIDAFYSTTGAMDVYANNIAFLGAYANQIKPFVHSNESKVRYGDIRKGTTATRPSNPIIGQQYYDTTLSKPVWWNGSSWKDGSGTTV